METLFFFIAFTFLFVFERTRRVQSAQWNEVLPEFRSDWEQYDIPTYQRLGIEIAVQEEVIAVEKKKTAPASRSRSGK